MRVSESVGQKLRRVNIDYSQFELPENSFDYYLKPVKPKLNYSKLLPKQQSPHREIPHTISCRIRPQISNQAYNDVINQTSLKTLPIRQLIPHNNNNRSFVLKHKKPSIEARYKQIMEYNVEEQFVELRRLMTRQKKSSSLGKRVKFLQ